MASLRVAALAGREKSVQVTLTGHVQGVGFRPFVYRLATQRGLRGRVRNRLGEVDIVACGPPDAIDDFIHALIHEAPPLAKPLLGNVVPVEPPDSDSFEIVASSAAADAKVFVPPDYFMCDDCRTELGDPADRRYRYPFINCTQCGPRYTLIAALPYDRPNTSMAGFPLCADCAREYADPADRRFHAEPVACPACGPRVEFRQDGDAVSGDDAVAAAIACLRGGLVLAVKGVGGYHLMCDAADERAVARLRDRKLRPSKPLAVMFPLEGSDGLAAVRRAVTLPAAAAGLLAGPARPVVLAPKIDAAALAANLAPGLDELGVFLPYAPLHQLRLAGFGGPLVATSGNLSGEPVLTDNGEAAARLSGIADAFLHHDRPILRPADDPVFRTVGGRPRPLRIGRGTAPLELTLPYTLAEPVLAVGGHMKGTVAIGWDDRVVVSPHIGEMDSPRSRHVLAAVAADLQSLYGVTARRIVCDAHPGYATRRFARAQRELPVTEIWHHHAHASALAAEHVGEGRLLVFTWDGVGLGPDGTLWGGEALYGRPGDWRRLGTMRSFRLPGGERAGREPWRSAAALFWECGLDWPACPDADGLLRHAWQRGLNAPSTSAVGRLFDAAAALVIGAHSATFEAEGPMRLEAVAGSEEAPVDLPIQRRDDGVIATDWAPLLPVLVDDRLTPSRRAGIFHSSMAGALAAQVRDIAARHPVDRIGLTGGVFQNRVLADAVMARLGRDGFDARLPEKLPANDAALSFGQVAEFAAGAR